MIKFLENTLLSDRQMFYYNGTKCPYCNGYNDFVDSSVVYQESHGMIYYCKDCQAWVGTHPNSDQALGFVAKKALRDLRIEATNAAKPLILKKIQNGIANNKAQALLRNWMAGILGIEPIECHIAMMGNERCKLFIDECKKWHKTPESIAVEKQSISIRKEMILFLSGALDFEVNEWALMGKTNMTFSKNGAEFNYLLEKNEGYWSTDKKRKYKPVDNLELFLDKHFTK